MTQRRIVQKIARQGACYEILECGHLGLVYDLLPGANIPEHPKTRRCEECKTRNRRRKNDGLPPL